MYLIKNIEIKKSFIYKYNINFYLSDHTSNSNIYYDLWMIHRVTTDFFGIQGNAISTEFLSNLCFSSKIFVTLAIKPLLKIRKNK